MFHPFVDGPKRDMDEPQTLLILVGLPGSGKTTFAEALVARSVEGGIGGSSTALAEPVRQGGLGNRRWVRASQDDAPNRRRQECEAAVRRGLAEGHNVLVDRVGFDRVQRSHFIQIARQHQPPPRIWCLVLSVSPGTLERRLLARPDHPTIKDPETAIRVLHEMTRLMDPPRPGAGEGFDRIFELDEQSQSPGGVWSEEEIARVLKRIQHQGKGDEGTYVPIEPRPAEQGARGADRGGYRGHSRGRGGYYRGGRYGQDYQRGPLQSPRPPPGAYAPHPQTPGYRPPELYARGRGQGPSVPWAPPAGTPYMRPAPPS